MKNLSLDSTLKDLLNDKEAKTVLKNHFGEVVDSPYAIKVYDKTLKKIYIALPAKISKKEIQQINDELMSL
jgi:hypothetical protein